MREKEANFYYNLYGYAGLDPQNFLINCLPSLYLLFGWTYVPRNYIYVIWAHCHILFRNRMTLNIEKIIVGSDESPCWGTPSIKTKQDIMFLTSDFKNMGKNYPR